MKRLLKIELQRGIISRSMVYALLLGSIITIWHVFQNAIPTLKRIEDGMTYLMNFYYPDTVFSSWIGGSNYTVQSFLYYMLLPIIATIPFATSFFQDQKSGYAKNVLIRASKKDYYISKYIATFISGGIATLIPLLLNLIITAMILPSLLPVVTGNYSIVETSMWSNVFYTHPYIYVFAYLAIDFIFAGLVATIALSISFFVEHKFIVLIAPFFICLFIYSLCNLIGATSFAPLYFLQPDFSKSRFLIIFVETLILGGATASIFFGKGLKEDVY